MFISLIFQMHVASSPNEFPFHLLQFEDNKYIASSLPDFKEFFTEVALSKG